MYAEANKTTVTTTALYSNDWQNSTDIKSATIFERKEQKLR